MQERMQNEKPRILVVDDEKFNRTVLTELLKPEYTVILAKNGLQALEKARSQYPPELILMDVVMPDMDGYTACEQLKASPETKDIPVVFVTSLLDADDETKGLEIGAIDYIGKPFSPAIVLARVRNHLALAQANRKLSEAHALLEEKNRQLQLMATKDSLTGLDNRFSLEEALEREVHHVSRCELPLSLLIMDIDHFKRVNDTWGHQVGDDTLRIIATLLKDNVRASDIVGRWGGEEFLIVCPATDSIGAETLAEHLRKSISDHYFVDAGNVTVSFGAATYIPGETIASFVNRSDRGLYCAKANGRNLVKVGEKVSSDTKF